MSYILAFSIKTLNQSINQSINYLYSTSSQQKSSHDTWAGLERAYSLIHLFTETQHFPHEQALGDSGEEKKCLLTGRNLEQNWTQWWMAICLDQLGWERERERKREREEVWDTHKLTHTHTHTQTHRQTHTLMSLPEWENDQSCYHKHYGKENKESFAGFLPFRIVE